MYTNNGNNTRNQFHLVKNINSDNLKAEKFQKFLCEYRFFCFNMCQ